MVTAAWIVGGIVAIALVIVVRFIVRAALDQEWRASLPDSEPPTLLFNAIEIMVAGAVVALVIAQVTGAR